MYVCMYRNRCVATTLFQCKERSAETRGDERRRDGKRRDETRRDEKVYSIVDGLSASRLSPPNPYCTTRGLRTTTKPK